MAKPNGNGGGMETAAAAARNRFDSVFGIPVFTAEKLRKPYVFETGSDKGTAQTALASVIFPEVGGIEGNAFRGCRIVKRVSADGKTVKLALVMPTYSIGGPVKYPVMDTSAATEATQKEYAAFRDGVLLRYRAWRKEQIAQGHKDVFDSGSAGPAQVTLGADDIAELGL